MGTRRRTLSRPLAIVIALGVTLTVVLASRLLLRGDDPAGSTAAGQLDRLQDLLTQILEAVGLGV